MSECNCDIVIDAGYVSESVMHRIGAALVLASAVALSVIAFGMTERAIDGAVASDFAVSRGGALVIDSAVVSDSVAFRANGLSVIVERARARSAVKHTASMVVIDSAASADSLADGLVTVLADSATASSVLAHSGRGGNVAIDRGRVRDFEVRRFASEVLGTAQADSLVISSARTVTLAIDAAHAASQTLDDAVSASIDISAARAESWVVSGATGSQSVIDEAWSDDFTTEIMPGVIWTCESDTFGMSCFSGDKLSALASIDGRLVGAAPAGIQEFDGAPYGGKICTGLTDFELPSMKRAFFAYVGYRGSPLVLSVGNTGSGQEETFIYPLPEKRADTAIAGKFKLGRGARSRYWRVGVSGPSFELHSAELVITETSRNV